MKGLKGSILCLTLGTALGLCSGTFMNQKPVWASETGAEESTVLLYEDLEKWVNDGNLQVQIDEISHNRLLSSYEQSREELGKLKSALRKEASEREKDEDTEGAEHYRRQAKQLEDALEDLDRQIRLTKRDTGTWEQTKKMMLQTAQNLMGTYESLRLDLETAKAFETLCQSQYEKTEQKCAIGMASEKERDQAKVQADSASDQVRFLTEEAGRARRELLLMAGISQESPVEIGTFPEPDFTRVETMDPEKDKIQALGNHYELQQKRTRSGLESNKELHARQRERQQLEENICVKLQAGYEDVLVCKEKYLAAQTKSDEAESAWNGAERKMKLGMLSKQDYLEARYEYLKETAGKMQAGIGLELSMEAYEDMKKGIGF